MHTGDVLRDRFEIVEAAGSGGMGVVYRAIDRATGSAVAIKLLHDAASPQHVARFAHEAEILGEIDHPNVVRYVTHGVTASEEPYLVMEWLDGVSLAEHLKRGPLSIGESIELVRRVASALAAAHGRGVVHRDIKPSNVFLPDERIENAKLLDFGIARLERATTPLTATGMLLGTPGYMAPEQARGDGAAIDPRTDMFSLGCVLFECLTGKPAFQGVHAIALLAKLLMEELPRVRELRPDVPTFLDELCASMLSKDPAKRPPDGAAVVLVLDKRESATPSFRPRALALTDAENRLVSVIAIATRAAETNPANPDSTVLSALSRDQLAKIRQAVVPFGAKLEELANGTLVALLVGAGPATDQAAAAARCALRIRSLMPHSPIVLLTGRGVSTERLPVGEVLDSAASMLEALNADWVGRGADPWVRIDETTRALLDVRFDVIEEQGKLGLQGEREIGGEARTLLGKPSPFVGRDRELRNLLEILEESFEEGRASVTLVTGPAGMGKSRLRYELTRKLRASRPEVVVSIGRGDSIGAGSAFGMLASAFRSSLGISRGESLSSQQGKLWAVVERFVDAPERQRVATFLGELIGAPFSDEENPQLRAARQDAPTMASRIERAYVDFARAAAGAVPVLLVLEDLHWGDVPSVKLIDAALRHLHDKPFTVVAFARPEVEELFPGLWRERDVQEIRLAPLSRRSAENLSRSVIGDSFGAGVVSNIVDRAGGNAFYLEELIRAVAEGRGQTLPETVLGMVEARLSTLSPEARRILRAASVFGEVFWERGVLALLGEEQAGPARETLEELCARELVVLQMESRFAGEKQYTFRHALVREGAYAMLTEQDLALGHQVAGEWLVEAGEEDGMVLAAHFERGGLGKRAAEFYARAAEQAHRGADLDAAIARAEKGLACGPEGEVAAALNTVLGMAHLLNSRFPKSLKHFLAAVEALGEDSPSVSAPMGFAVCSALYAGQLDVFTTLLPRLMQTEPSPSGVATAVQALWAVGITLVMFGKHEDGLPFYQRMERIVAAHPGDLLAAGHGNAFRTNWISDIEHDLWRSHLCARASISSYEVAGARQYIPLIDAHYMMQTALLGRLEEAAIGFDRILAAPDSGNLATAHASLWKCHTLVWTNKLAQAKALAEKLLQMATGDQLMTWAALLVNIECLILMNRLDEAEQALVDVGDPASMIPCMRASHLSLRAKLRRRQGRLEDAADLAALAVVQGKLGPRFHYGDNPFLLRHAVILHELGHEKAARSVLAEARDDLLARAEKIPDPDIKRTFLENVPHNRRTLELAREWLATSFP
ncbi:MAG: protein kinase [Polyangiaceae bacterium]|nr:protein kinase [Polyangiaceae bacterium]